MYQGRYFVADFFGRVFSLGLTIAPNGEAQVTDAIDHTAELGSPRLISTFGRGQDGELYFSSFTGGRILKIVPSTAEAPAPPVSTTSEVSGSTVRISWQNGATGGSPTSFVLEAGSQPGAANLLVTSAPFSPLVVEGVPNGLYYVRVRAVNALGVSQPSNEVEVLVGCIAPPAAPTAPVATVSGNTVSLQWTAAAQAASYIVEAGSAPGLADFAAIPSTTTSLGGAVPSGTYYVRVRGVNQCGTGTASEEIVVTVP
jgi:predicted phage tail protein